MSHSRYSLGMTDSSWPLYFPNTIFIPNGLAYPPGVHRGDGPGRAWVKAGTGGASSSVACVPLARRMPTNIVAAFLHSPGCAALSRARARSFWALGGIIDSEGFAGMRVLVWNFRAFFRQWPRWWRGPVFLVLSFFFFLNIENIYPHTRISGAADPKPPDLEMAVEFRVLDDLGPAIGEPSKICSGGGRPVKESLGSVPDR